MDDPAFLWFNLKKGGFDDVYIYSWRTPTIDLTPVDGCMLLFYINLFSSSKDR